MGLFQKWLDYTYVLSHLYYLLWPLTSIMGGAVHWYVLLLKCSITFQKGFIPIAVRSLMPYLIYPWWYTQVTSGTLAKSKFPKVLTWYYHKSQGINLVALCYSECCTFLIKVINICLVSIINGRLFCLLYSLKTKFQMYLPVPNITAVQRYSWLIPPCKQKQKFPEKRTDELCQSAIQPLLLKPEKA